MTLSISISSANIVINPVLNIHNETCPICRYSLMEKCLECDNDESTNCISVIGTCGHGYHFHCISTWLKTKTICPLDNSKWEFKKHSEICNCIKKQTINVNSSKENHIRSYPKNN